MCRVWDGTTTPSGKGKDEMKVGKGRGGDVAVKAKEATQKTSSRGYITH